jgi:K+-transporting ATPase KdpF subunit
MREALTMSVENWVVGSLCIGLCVYLVVALVRPEWF